MVQPLYELRVRGEVPDEDLKDVRAVTLAPEHVTTAIYEVCDEAALHGLLARLRVLGIEVVEVRRVSPLPDTDEASPSGEREDEEEQR